MQSYFMRGEENHDNTLIREDQRNSNILSSDSILEQSTVYVQEDSHIAHGRFSLEVRQSDQPQSQPQCNITQYSYILDQSSVIPIQAPENNFFNSFEEKEKVTNEVLQVSSYEELLTLLNSNKNSQKTIKIGDQVVKLNLQLIERQKNSIETQVSENYCGVKDNQVTPGNTAQPDKNVQQLSQNIINDRYKQIDINKIMNNWKSDDAGLNDDLLFEGIDDDSQDDNINLTKDVFLINQKETIKKNMNQPIYQNDQIVANVDNQQTNRIEENKVQIKEPILLKKHFSQISQFHPLFDINSNHQIQTSTTYNYQHQINMLTSSLCEKNKEVNCLRETLSKISTCLAKIYSTPKLLSNDFEDKELIKILSQGFLAQAKLHLAFLFSSPLIMMYKDQNSIKPQTMNAIDHAKELNGVLEGLRETGNQIRYRRIPASLDNLRLVLTENPIALHFSGHGIENSQQNFGKDSILHKDAGNFLIFEDQEGCAYFLSEKMLHQLLESSGTKLEFVFVASCYSQFAGEIFHNAGAKHVICVKKGHKIQDEAAIIFSRAFYHALFSQTVTVCQAFEFAKATLFANQNKFVANEALKFVLLKDNDEITLQNCSENVNLVTPMKGPKKHKCTVFGPFVKGQIENIGIQPLFKLEVSKVEDFLGRKREMQEILSNIMENRLVTIKGIPGIGKTTIAKAVAFYLNERYAFKDGIIFESLRSIHSANMFLDRLYVFINKILKDKDDNKPIDNVNHQLDRIIEVLKDKQVLIVLDNAEDPLRVEGQEIKEIWQIIFTKCPNVKFLITSRNPVGSLQDITEKIIHLKELTPNFSIELLLKKAMRPIKDSEIEELLKSADPRRVLHSNPLKTKTTRLDEHHMCFILGGHPHAISLAAPLLQDKSLKELYALLNSYEIMDWLRDGGVGKPIASLKVSLDTSIQYMQQSEPQAIKLFCLIGLLPGGCTEEDLNALWGHDWLIYAERLLRASLLLKRNEQSGEIRYTLLPFMNKYAEDLMDPQERLDVHDKCSKYFSKICKDLFKLNQNFSLTTTFNINEVMNKLVQFETNIWACIYRMIDKKNEYANEPGLSYSQTRAKSPALSFYDLARSQDNSSIGGNSDDKGENQYEDEENMDYDAFLNSRRQDGRRSMSERTQKLTRSLMDSEIAQKLNVEREEEKSSSLPSQEQESKQDSFQRTNTGTGTIEERGSISEEEKQIANPVSYFQPQSLVQSIDDSKNIVPLVYLDKKHGSSLQSLDVIVKEDIETVFPTQQIASLLSDDQTSFSQQSTSFKEKRAKHILKTEQNLHHQQRKDITVENDQIPLSQLLQEHEQELFKDLIRQSSIESQNTSLILQSTSRITSAKLQTLQGNTPSIRNHLDDTLSTIQNIGDQMETSQNDSLDDQFLSSGQSICQEQHQYQLAIIPKNTNTRRKSQRILLPNIEEIAEEHSVILDDEDCESNRSSEQKELQPSLKKKLSKQKYQEDNKFQENDQNQMDYLNIPMDINKDEQSGLDETKEKKKKKKVNFEQIDHSDAEPARAQELKKTIQLAKKQEKVCKVELTSEGSLFVYYVSNLILLTKYQEAQKAIEQFGLKLEDNLCKANLKKLQGLILYNHDRDYITAQKKFDEAARMFKELDSIHGQALCNCAAGLILYQKKEQFLEKNVDETQIINKAKRRFEEAVSNYQKIQHFAGEGYCHKLLCHVKQILSKPALNHVQQQKFCMKKEQELQKENKSSFIQRSQGIEVSLFVEVIDQIKPEILNEREQFSNSKAKPQLSTVNSNNKRNFKPETQKKLQEDKIQAPPNIKQVNPKKKELTIGVSNIGQKEKTLQKAEQEQLQYRIRQSNLEEAKDICKDPKTERKTIVEKKNPPKINKQFQASMNKSNLDKINKQTQNDQLSSDNESQIAQSTQNSKKQKIDFIAKGIQQVQHYQNSRNERINKANTSKQSSSFIISQKKLMPKKNDQVRKDSDHKTVQEDENPFEKAEYSSNNNSFEYESSAKQSFNGHITDQLESIDDKKRRYTMKNETQLPKKQAIAHQQPQMQSMKVQKQENLKPSAIGSRTQTTSPRPVSPGFSSKKVTKDKESLQQAAITQHIVKFNITANITIESDINGNKEISLNVEPLDP